MQVVRGRSNTRTFLWQTIAMGRHRRGRPCLFKVHAVAAGNVICSSSGTYSSLFIKSLSRTSFTRFPLFFASFITGYNDRLRFSISSGNCWIIPYGFPLAASHIRAHKPNRYSIRSELL